MGEKLYFWEFANFAVYSCVPRTLPYRREILILAFMLKTNLMCAMFFTLFTILSYTVVGALEAGFIYKADSQYKNLAYFLSGISFAPPSLNLYIFQKNSKLVLIDRNSVCQKHHTRNQSDM